MTAQRVFRTPVARPEDRPERNRVEINYNATERQKTDVGTYKALLREELKLFIDTNAVTPLCDDLLKSRKKGETLNRAKEVYNYKMSQITKQINSNLYQRNCQHPDRSYTLKLII